MTSVQRRQKEKELRRKEIIDAAESLFFSRGYDSVSMDDIAAKIDLNKATIYLYFENKESLFYTVVLRGVTILNELIDGRVQKKRSGIDRVMAVWNAYLEFVKDHPDHFRTYAYFQSGRFGLENMVDIDPVGKTPLPSFGNPVVYNIPNGQIVKEILDQHRKVFDTLCGAVKKGIEEGAIRPDCEPAEVSALLLILVEGTLKMNPLVYNELGQHGISKQKFLKDIHRYLIVTREKN
jgi:TetR/AcrR family transcriptional regulator